MLGKLKSYFFEQKKKKLLPDETGRKAEFHFQRKNNYGLLVDATIPEHRKIVSEFAEKLRKEGNSVKVLGFIDGKNDQVSLSFDVFHAGDLHRISGVPKSPLVDAFMSGTYDVLINFSIYQNHKPLEFISSITKAKFRIGPWYPGLVRNPFDLSIDTGSQVTLREWIGELMQTLQKIY